MAYKIGEKEMVYGSLADSKVKHIEIWGMDIAGVVKQVDMEKRQLTIVGTSEDKDRDGDIITVKGWQLDNYRKNPVFLWAHDYRSVPIGGATKIVKRRDPPRMEFTIKFPSQGLYPFADLILSLYGEKIINASSVGFIPLKWEDLEDENDDEKPSLFFHLPRRYLEQELLELSGCAVPSNPNALQDALTAKSIKGLDSDPKILTKYILGQEPKCEGILCNVDKRDEVMYEIGVDDMEIEIEKDKTVVQVPADIKKEDEDEEEVVVIEWTEPEEKPFKNEHACDLGKGPYDRYRRKNCEQKHDNKCIDVVYGIKNNKSEISSLRYKVDVWTESDAKRHCESRKGTFVPAVRMTDDIIEHISHRYDFILKEDFKMEMEEKRVGGSRSLPLDSGADWDGNAATMRMRKLAGGPDKENMNWAKYRRGFVWYNEKDVENFGSYKLPFADVIGGTLKAKWGGVRRAMGAVLGARRPPNIGGDKRACYDFLASYYRKFDKPVPEYHMYDEDIINQAIEDAIVGKLTDEMRKQIKEILEDFASLGCKLTSIYDMTIKPSDDDAVSQSTDDDDTRHSHADELFETILADKNKNKSKNSKSKPQHSEASLKGLADAVKKLKEQLKSI